ncbi:NAD(P)/FAD-dependent oxidoreductase [Azospirillum picis]|uniref:Glycine/D-amino acid oxidase-like deaminating enzyme n=1 Tax=Azospirillum picis TaxID=488438 RepID=A0ABU0MTB0_9PROT|nr:FAD-binding oxidoreductase [Azospirillum picis]MBP2302708.1 glycine/D-amino acid oxidase-like deaminating enzyme [Azospirillum picis]MDQ0536459.1 glycine/D-amino acid oxidase-like deaminating enzyme [Azospirillum picis]
MLNDKRTHGLWEQTAPAAPATTVLSGTVKADVVIVGGGYTGLSAALHLAESGIDAVVVEAVEVGFGGAGRNVGLVNAGMWVMPDQLVETLGPVYGERLIELLGNAPRYVFEMIDRHKIACEDVRSGTLHCGVGTAGLRELEQRAAIWQKRGAPVRLLDAAETAEKVGTRAYSASLLDLRAGTIQPLAYARGLATAALAAGARIFTGSPVLSTGRTGSQTGGCWEVRTAGGAVQADWVVVATDAYSTGPWTAIRNEQVHLPYFNLATEPLPDAMQRAILPERQGVWDTRQVLSSYRFDRQGRLVFGSVGALQGTGASVHRAWARRALARLFPQLGPIRFEQEWYGQIGMTSDNLPRFHQLGRNVIGFSGYNGRGIAPGTVLGRCLAEHIAGRLPDRDLPLPDSLTETVRGRAAREAFYDYGAQATHMVGARLPGHF